MADQDRGGDRPQPIPALPAKAFARAVPARTRLIRVPAALARPLSERRVPGSPVRPPRAPGRARRWIGRTAVVMLAGLFVLLATYVNQVVSSRDAAADRSAADYRQPSTLADRPVVCVIGDEDSLPTVGLGSTPVAWPALVGRSTEVSMVTLAQTDSGYGVRGPMTGGTTFVEGAASVPPDSGVVILFGGEHDARLSAARFKTAVDAAIRAARARAPRARIVLVGPLPSASEVGEADALAGVRAVLKRAAASEQAAWVDPVEQGWLSAGSWAPVGGLSDAGERQVAERMTQVVDHALGRR